MVAVSSIWALRRSATDVKLAGLCSGLAERWQVDPTVVRVGFAVLALSGGLGIVLYLAGWFLLPVAGRDRAPVDDMFKEQVRKWPREAWAALVVIAGLGVLGVFGSVLPFGFGPALIVALIWYFGFYRTRVEQPVPPPAPAALTLPPSMLPSAYPDPPTPFTEAAEAWRRRVEERVSPVVSDPSFRPDPSFWTHPDPAGLYTDATPRGGEPAIPEPRARQLPPSAGKLRLVALVVLGLTLSGLGVADRLGAAIPVAVYPAAALGVVGLVLVAAAWLGRSRGLLPLGLILTLAVIGTSTAGPVVERYDWASAERTYVSPTDLPARGDSLSAGRLEVDLSQLPVTQNLVYRAHVDLGSLEVRVPRDVAVRVTYRVESGVMLAYSEQVDRGADLGDVIEPVDLKPGAPVLTLDLSVDRGHLQVSR